MAGRRPVPAEQAMDNLNQILPFTIRGAITTIRIPLFVAERDVCIEDFRARWGTAESTAATLNLVLRKVASGTAMSGSSTAITEDGGATGSVNVKGTADVVNVAAFQLDSRSAPSENIVKGDIQPTRSGGTVTKGEMVFAQFELNDGTGTAPTELADLIMTLRVSTRRD